MALLDAHALALSLRTENDLAAALSRTVALRRAHIALYQAMSRVFTPFYQSDSRALPLLRDTLVGRLARVWPINSALAILVAGLVGDPLTKLGLSRKGLYDPGL